VGERTVTAALRGGHAVEIRPIEPSDRETIRAAFERLSAESVYRRFFGPMPVLRERDLAYLTEVDHHDHEALIAFDADSGDGVGVARFVRTAAHVAEPAVVVVDDWQGRGVGAALAAALVERRAPAVRRVQTLVATGNRPSLAMLARLGRMSTGSPHAGSVDVRVELSAGR
jgi:GNAT superfamily N-acetyltransferase